MNLSPNDRAMLAKLLAMTSSSFEGEASAAMHKANALLTARGAQWNDVLLVKPSRPRLSPYAPGWPKSADPDHVSVATRLLRQGKSVLTTWELGFLRSILSYRQLQAKQTEILALISRKVDLARAGAA